MARHQPRKQSQNHVAAKLTKVRQALQSQQEDLEARVAVHHQTTLLLQQEAQVHLVAPLAMAKIVVDQDPAHLQVAQCLLHLVMERIVAAQGLVRRLESLARVKIAVALALARLLEETAQENPAMVKTAVALVPALLHLAALRHQNPVMVKIAVAQARDHHQVDPTLALVDHLRPTQHHPPKNALEKAAAPSQLEVRPLASTTAIRPVSHHQKVQHLA